MIQIIKKDLCSGSLKQQAFEGVAQHFVSTIVVTTSGAWDVAKLPGLIATEDDRCVGAIFWRTEGSEREIVSLHSFPKLRGVGTMLVARSVEMASVESVKRLWLVSTNDNIDALRFYQRRGFRLAKVHRGSIDEARLLKPGIPLFGDYGIEIHDDIELEILL